MEKDLKKVTRKQAKALQVAKKDFEICESEKPSQNVLVCNAGLVTGASRYVFDTFQDFSQPTVKTRKQWNRKTTLKILKRFDVVTN